MKILVILLALAATSCAQLNTYCSEGEMRAAIRQLNPYDFIDAVGIAGCAAVETFVVNQEGESGGE